MRQEINSFQRSAKYIFSKKIDKTEKLVPRGLGRFQNLACNP